MIRLLIVLITLNAIFPIAGIASVCASNTSKVSTISSSSMTASTTSTDKADHDAMQAGTAPENTASSTMKMHCNDPDMACYDSDKDGFMQSMDCDSSCCNNCLGVTAAITMTPSQTLPYTPSIKPVSTYLTFYTRSISPELQPPLA